MSVAAENLSRLPPVRPNLDEMDLPTGKKARLYNLLYAHGPGNGTMLILPVDQGLEHGPRDFEPNPDAEDMNWVLNLCEKGAFSGIAIQIGMAEKYMSRFAGRVPLILKLNGKTEIPPDDEAFSPCQSSVEDAVRLGADAVGYTMYIGSPRQDDDFIQFSEVRQEATRFGMPVIVWAYPRGSAVEKKGGRDSLYQVSYAARVACELGADVVKVNFPKSDEKARTNVPEPYNTLDIPPLEAMRSVVRAAGKTFVLVSGGGGASDEKVLQKARLSMEAGATGLIFGRNVWQRKMDHALEISRKIAEMMRGV
jgi:class I fructose-bisphosphate aldolase